MLVILPSFVLKHLAVGQPLYIGDTDIIIIINKDNIKVNIISCYNEALMSPKLLLSFILYGREAGLVTPSSAFCESGIAEIFIWGILSWGF